VAARVHHDEGVPAGEKICALDEVAEATRGTGVREVLGNDLPGVTEVRADRQDDRNLLALGQSLRNKDVGVQFGAGTVRGREVVLCPGRALRDPVVCSCVIGTVSVAPAPDSGSAAPDSGSAAPAVPASVPVNKQVVTSNEAAKVAIRRLFTCFLQRAQWCWWARTFTSGVMRHFAVTAHSTLGDGARVAKSGRSGSGQCGHRAETQRGEDDGPDDDGGHLPDDHGAAVETGTDHDKGGQHGSQDERAEQARDRHAELIDLGQDLLGALAGGTTAGGDPPVDGAAREDRDREGQQFPTIAARVATTTGIPVSVPTSAPTCDSR